MWALENTTPYTAERTWVIDQKGEKSWVVIVKATYEILDNSKVVLSEKQEDPLFTSKYSGEEGKSSILYDVDMVPIKSATDILLNGHAYAPQGKSVRKLDVVLRVGSLKKQLTVFGNRRWTKSLLLFGALSMTRPEFFQSIPISYEMAFGGWDTKSNNTSDHRLYQPNPIGRGFGTKQAHLDGELLPHIEDPKHLINSWKDRPPTAGFGVVASYWSPRLELAGTYDDNWMQTKAPLLPNDFHPKYFQSAPANQQYSGFLDGGEEVELENLSENGPLRFCLPKVRLTFKTLFGKDDVEHRAKLHTVIIEPDLSRIIMAWQTCLPCHHKADALDTTIIAEKKYVKLETSRA